jgi:hypothetical protein
MEKVKKRKVNHKFKYFKTEEFETLEVPTLLKRLFLTNQIFTSEYTEKLRVYYNAVHLKNSLINENSEFEGKQLRDYQQRIVNYAKNLNSFAIFDEPRLGKTPTVIELVKEKGLLDKKIIIMCPGKVIGNWIKEFKKWSNKEVKKYEGGIIEENIIITTYERARISLDEILFWGPEVAILDEAHILRNSRGVKQRLTKSQAEIKEEDGFLPRNVSILKIGEQAKNRYTLTGTPGVNKAEDIFPILQFLMPKTYKKYWVFCEYFFNISRGYFGGYEVNEIRADKETELQEILDYLSSNNKQEEAMPWLKKPKVFKTNIELNDIQKKLENDLLEFSMIGDQFVLNTLEHYTHYMSIVSNPKTINKKIKVNSSGAKIEYILKKIKEFPEKNIAIFSARAKTINELEKTIREEFKNKKIYSITAKTKDSESIKIQDEINKKSKKSGIILLGSIGVCKEGISLEGLEKAYVIDQVWIASHMIQLFHRLDATTKEAQEYFGEKEIEILHAPGTIDDLIQNILDEKKSKTDLINDYKKFIERKRK